MEAAVPLHHLPPATSQHCCQHSQLDSLPREYYLNYSFFLSLVLELSIIKTINDKYNALVSVSQLLVHNCQIFHVYGKIYHIYRGDFFFPISVYLFTAIAFIIFIFYFSKLFITLKLTIIVLQKLYVILKMLTHIFS